MEFLILVPCVIIKLIIDGVKCRRAKVYARSMRRY